MKNKVDNEIHFVTGNQSKFDYAKSIFEEEGINIIKTELDITEVQDSDYLVIAKLKAKEAWDKIKEPLFIHDSCWTIPSLNGFPGPYMRYVNEWFSPSDFISLMKDKKDKTIILRSTVIYIDDKNLKEFSQENHGSFLEQPYSGYSDNSLDAVVSFSKSGKSIAEQKEEGSFVVKKDNLVWGNFVKWLKENNSYWQI